MLKYKMQQTSVQKLVFLLAFVLFLTVFALEAVIKTSSTCAGREPIVYSFKNKKQQTHVHLKKKYVFSRTQQFNGVELNRRKENMKKRRSNAIIRNKLFAMIMASVSDTHRMRCHMKTNALQFHKC